MGPSRKKRGGAGGAVARQKEVMGRQRSRRGKEGYKAPAKPGRGSTRSVRAMIPVILIAAASALSGTPPPSLNSIQIGALAAACSQADKTECRQLCDPAAACWDYPWDFILQEAASYGPWGACAGYQPCRNLTAEKPGLSAGATAGIVVGGILGPFALGLAYKSLMYK